MCYKIFYLTDTESALSFGMFTDLKNHVLWRPLRELAAFLNCLWHVYVCTCLCARVLCVYVRISYHPLVKTIITLLVMLSAIKYKINHKTRSIFPLSFILVIALSRVHTNTRTHTPIEETFLGVILSVSAYFIVHFSECYKHT